MRAATGRGGVCATRYLKNGAQGRNRTTDTAIFSRMLYQLSYLGTAPQRWRRVLSPRLHPDQAAITRYRAMAELPPPVLELLSGAEFIQRIDQLMRPVALPVPCFRVRLPLNQFQAY